MTDLEMEQDELIEFLRDKNKDLEQENKQLKEEINKMSKDHLELFGDMKTYKNLWLAEQRKVEELKERIQNILEGKEIPAICAKKYEEYEEQLQEQIDYKEEYYYYWQETKKELAIREKALRIAVANVGTADKFVPINRELDVFVGNIYQSNEFCMKNGIKDGWINVDDAMYDYFIKQAKEKQYGKS